MTEIKRIISLFEKLYSKEPWIDINLLDTLSNITIKQATNRIGNCNTIWEIVVHIIEWRVNVIKRLKGEIIITPDNNYFTENEDKSTKNWNNTLQLLDNSQKEWISFLEWYDTKNLNKKYTTNQMTHYEHVQGILQHDSYHLGQIVLLLKLINEK